MDAVKFIEERRRMSKATRGYSPIMLERIPPEDIVKEVEEWAAAHPRRTRQDVFLEQWPETVVEDDGILQIDPCLVSATHRNKYGGCAFMKRKCTDCRREFWTKVVG